ncbi:MAG: dTMP kinase, partial [Planctomycetes bacterium]|nr:dTMP kinase [Planctomycetota bacterium]
MNDYTGTYIVIEGIDGTGKSTLIKGIADALRQGGVSDLERYEEPTDGPNGQKIRELLASDDNIMSAEEWLLLFESDRRDNVARVVPALERGAFVLQDRSFYSTAAYQGAQGMDVAEILRRNRAFAPEPDMVLVLDLDPKIALERIQKRKAMEADAFEREEYLARVRMIYHAMKGRNLAVIDAEQSPEAVLASALGV